jgi:hypothetical protein
MRYTLEKYKGLKTRFNCPQCNGKKTFTRYIDIETNEYLSDHVGRCNRIDNCGYHEKPPLLTKCFFVPFESLIDYNIKSYKIYASNNSYYLPKSQIYEVLGNGCYLSEWYLTKGNALKKPDYSLTDFRFYNDCKVSVISKAPLNIAPLKKAMFTMPILQLEETLINYDNNNFALILAKLFGYENAAKLLSLYGIGTSNKWFGANIFWQIDYMGIVRTGKIMLYNAETLKRVKEPYDHISWIHKGLIEDTKEIKQCFFGEHLINCLPSKPIAIVESEKTAIICAHFMPDYIWLSAGNINGLNIEKFKVLQGRKVVLFPDLGKASEIWQQKANEFKHIAEVTISDYLQRIATPEQKATGLDLADFYIESINVAHVGNVA